MRLARMHAGGKGVQAADAMGQPVLHQKIQRAIGHRGLVAEPFRRQPLQHVIGPQRAVLFQQDFQNPAAHWCQLHPLRQRQRLAPRQHVIGAGAVVMPGKGHLWRCGATGASVGMGMGMRLCHGAS